MEQKVFTDIFSAVQCDNSFMELGLFEYIRPNLFMKWYSEENKRLAKSWWTNAVCLCFIMLIRFT